MSNTSADGGPLLPEDGTPTLSPDDPFDDLLQSLVVGITGMPGHLVRPRWQSVPPSEPEAETDWCAIGQIEDDPGFNYFERHDGDGDGGLGTTTTQIQSVIRILASFYGPHARGYASKFRNGIMVPQNREALFPYGVALQQMPGVARFVPAIVSFQSRPKVDVEFLLRVPSVRVWAIRNIVAVPFTIEPDDGASVSVTVTED